MKTFLYYLATLCYALAVIGGFGYTAMLHKWVIAISILVLGGLAFPTIRKFFKELTKVEPKIDEWTESHTSKH